MSVNRIQFTGNTAEVAKVISISPVSAIAGEGKGHSPKELPEAKRAFPGAAQNMRGTVIQSNRMLCCRVKPKGLPCAACTGVSF